jgi:Holliday junction resolvase
VRKAAKVDSNQGDIVRALRKAGCNVLSLAAVGNGCPDLLAYRAGLLYLIEIKDGNKSPSRIKLTPHQVRFHRDWPVHVVTNESEALKIIEAALQSGKQPEAAA